MANINVPFYNTGTVDAESGILSLDGGYALAGGTLNFGITSLANFGQINLSGAAALTGTTVGVLKIMIASTAAGKQGFALTGLVTGLTVGTGYYIDVGLKAVTGGTATIYDLDVTAIEL